MLVEAGKETLCINQIIGQKNHSAIIEEDFVVPDIKPDILNSINTNGTVCVYKKEVMDGKIKIEGCVNTYIIYLADTQENQIRSLNTNLNFSEIIDFDNLKIGMMVDTNISIKEIECRVLNGRKINVRAILDINLTGYSNENLEFVNDVGSIKDVQVLKEGISINSLLGTGSTKIYAKDTIMISDVDDLAEIMKINVDIKNKETKISYNKILIKADSIIKIMYLTTDNRICCKTATIPIMGFIDMQDVSDDNICDVRYEIKNILIKPKSSEEHSIYVEIEIDATACCYTTNNLDIIKDLYSPSIDLNYKQNIIKTMADKNCIKDVCPIREKQVIEDMQNCEIYDVDVKPNIINQNAMEDRIIFEGEIEINYIYFNRDSNTLNNKLATIPFNYNMNCPGINQTSKVDTSIEVSTQDFVIMPDASIDVKIDLQITVNSFRNEDINLIQEINTEENRDNPRYSIIIYFVKPEDTLWKIAKRFRSTVDAIATLNNIENQNKINIGQQIFIPMAI